MMAVATFWLLCLGLFLDLAADAPTLDEEKSDERALRPTGRRI